MIASISLQVTCLLPGLDLILVCGTYPENCPFLHIFQFWGSNYSMDFLSVCCYVPIFISDFVNLNFVSLLISLNKGLSILLIFSKTHLFVPLTLCFIYFVSILLILVLKLIISWYLLLLGETLFLLLFWSFQVCC